MGSAYLHTHLMPLSHGGDLLRLQRSLLSTSELQWIDLSSAVNREPWPVPAIPAESWMELPDLQCLLAAARDYYGRAELLPIAGTQQAIEWLPVLLPSVAKERPSIGESQADPSQPCKPIQRVMLPAIGYQEHAFAWKKWGYEICTYHSLDELLCTDWLVAVVIQPNNPTAERYQSAQLQALVELAHTRQAWVLVDEAFIDAIEEQSVLTKAWTQAWPDGLIVLRSVGKFFGLAGARVGFCFASEALLNALQLTIGPWPISTASAYVVAQALQDVAWQESARKSLQQRQQNWRERLLPRINDLGYGGRWAESELFFSLTLGTETQAKRLYEQLQSMGIHVRLGSTWLRFAIPSFAEFGQLETRLVALLAPPKGSL